MVNKRKGIRMTAKKPIDKCQTCPYVKTGGASCYERRDLYKGVVMLELNNGQQLSCGIFKHDEKIIKATDSKGNVTTIQRSEVKSIRGPCPTFIDAPISIELIAKQSRENTHRKPA